MAEGPGQTRARGPDGVGAAAAPAAQTGAQVSPPTDAAAHAAVEEPPEKAYVAPQVLPKPAVPVEAAPDAKVVLNLPASPVSTVSEAEVRAARARRRTATVKIERANVADSLKLADLRAAQIEGQPTSERPPPPAPRRQVATTPEPAVRTRPLPDSEEVTPLARPVRSSDAGPGRAAGEAPRVGATTPLPRAESGGGVATSREIDFDVDESVVPRKSNSGLIVGLAALVVVAGGGYYVVANVLPNTAPPPSAATTATEPPAAPPTVTSPAVAETTATGVPSSPPSQSVAAPATTTPPRTGARPPPRTAAPPPKPAPPPIAPRPAVKPTKSGDIPSEI
jgi:hypothetical protein